MKDSGKTREAAPSHPGCPGVPSHPDQHTSPAHHEHHEHPENLLSLLNPSDLAPSPPAPQARPTERTHQSASTRALGRPARGGTRPAPLPAAPRPLGGRYHFQYSSSDPLSPLTWSDGCEIRNSKLLRAKALRTKAVARRRCGHMRGNTVRCRAAACESWTSFSENVFGFFSVDSFVQPRLIQVLPSSTVQRTSYSQSPRGRTGGPTKERRDARRRKERLKGLKGKG